MKFYYRYTNDVRAAFALIVFTGLAAMACAGIFLYVESERATACDEVGGIVVKTSHGWRCILVEYPQRARL